MLSFLPYPLKLMISGPLLIANTIFFTLMLLPFILLKAIIPLPSLRDKISLLLVGTASLWVVVNFLIIHSMGKIHWDIEHLNTIQLKKDKNYLVVANHQSWIDILALQKIFTFKIPFFRFFLKDSLKWVPFLGLVWWSMDYPFMKRYTRKQIEANPKLKGENLRCAKKACKRFEKIPIAMMNFLEGTRFTKEKHQKTKSPFQHLLKPKAGGISLVLSALPKLDAILNVTIIYPNQKQNMNFFKFVAGELSHIIIKVEELPITEDLIGDYANDSAFREQFQTWSNALWEEKDALISKINA